MIFDNLIIFDLQQITCYGNITNIIIEIWYIYNCFLYYKLYRKIKEDRNTVISVCDKVLE